MKHPRTLDVTEFRRIVAAMLAQAEHELSSTRARLNALRTDGAPPG